LEYRGYDSAGMVIFDGKKPKIKITKTKGRVSELEDKIGKNWKGNMGIAHTRWATHGEPSEKNAHPHADCSGRVFVCHNGIIENYKALKQSLISRGHKFKSDTDTEVLAHLIEENMRYGEKAIPKALKQVRGTYGLAIIIADWPDRIILARNSSPLVIGIGIDENLVASDASAIVGRTRDVIYLNDGEGAILTQDNVKLFNISRLHQDCGGQAKFRNFSPKADSSLTEKISERTEKLEWNLDNVQKGGYPHFMLKEIFEQPESIENSFRGRLIRNEGLAKLGGLESIKNQLKDINRVTITACGTAYLAGLIGKYMMEEYSGVQCDVELASELRYRSAISKCQNLAMVAISQSGETADTLAVLKEAKEKRALTLGIVNVVGSTIARETDAGVYNHIGPEIGVASTKAFTSQVIILALLTLFLGRQRNMSLVMGKRIAEEIQKIPLLVKQVLKQNEKIKQIAKQYKNYNNFLYIGRKYNFPVALEGALKLKEISYIHAEGYGAGEMKHGPIAMIDKNFPTVALAPVDSVYEKMMSNMEEIKARQGKIIAITTEGNEKIKHIAEDWLYVPKTLEMLTPILSVIPLQLLAYHIGVLRGFDVDKPRNLAKSVTVE